MRKLVLFISLSLVFNFGCRAMIDWRELVACQFKSYIEKELHNYMALGRAQRMCDSFLEIEKMSNMDALLNVQENDTIYLVLCINFKRGLLFTPHDGIVYSYDGGAMRKRLNMKASFPSYLEQLRDWDYETMRHKSPRILGGYDSDVVIRCIIKDNCVNLIESMIVQCYRQWDDYVPLKPEEKEKTPPDFYNWEVVSMFYYR